MLKFKKLPFTKNQTFITSDTHYSHANICKATTSWDAGYRDFDSLEEMNSSIVQNINDLVKENDCLIHCGDWSFGGKQNVWNFRKQIACKNIYLQIGNHDQYLQETTKLYISDEDVYLATKLGIPTHFDTTYYLYTTDCFNDVNDIAYYQIEDQQIVFSHYPFVSWYHSTKGVWNLSGHEHAQMEEKYYYNKSMDVGIDAAFKMFGEYRPFSFIEIEELLEKKIVNLLNHH